MLYLIELYDRRTPMNNYLLCRLLRPDGLILMIPQDLGPDAVTKERFESFRRFFRLRTTLTVVRADTATVPRVADSLRRVIAEYGEENCAVGLIGGSEALLVAAGICLAEFPGLRAVMMRSARPEIIWGSGKLPDTPEELNADLSVRDLISLSAGEMLHCGHADWRTIDEGTLSLIPAIFDIYRRNREAWPSFTAYLQRLSNSRYRIRDEVLGGPLEFTTQPLTGRKVRLNPEIVQELRDIGVITDCRLSAVTGRLAFANPRLIDYLCDTGSWLELFVFTVLRGSGLFSDIEINPVVSWDNDGDDEDTVNEVDLIAVRGIMPLFISCKSGVPDAHAVNEIWTVRNRFGNGLAKAVLVTACDIQRDAQAVGKRADEYGVAVIDAPLLNPQALTAAFKNLLSRPEVSAGG